MEPLALTDSGTNVLHPIAAAPGSRYPTTARTTGVAVNAFCAWTRVHAIARKNGHAGPPLDGGNGWNGHVRRTRRGWSGTACAGSFPRRSGMGGRATEFCGVLSRQFAAAVSPFALHRGQSDPPTVLCDPPARDPKKRRDSLCQHIVAADPDSEEAAVGKNGRFLPRRESSRGTLRVDHLHWRHRNYSGSFILCRNACDPHFPVLADMIDQRLNTRQSIRSNRAK